MTAAKPTVLVLAHGELLEQILPDQVRAELESFAAVRYQEVERKLTEDELVEAVPEVEAAITTWGSPRFTARVVAAAPQLKIIAHAAGSVKPYVEPAAFEKGIVVVGSAEVIAQFVGEMALLLTLASLRELPRYNQALKQERRWEVEGFGPPDTLFRQRVGLIGFGATGRAFASVLKPFEVDLLCFDPHAEAGEMAALGARLASLEEILTTCRVISLHAASVPATEHLIDAERLRLIPDGAILINTARGTLIDMKALVEELKTGRFKAALDVFDPEEPLPPDHPLRDLPNVILTPHMAGPVPSRYWEMGRYCVDNVRRVCSGQPAIGAITAEQLGWKA